jgi:hypothetical protein
MMDHGFDTRARGSVGAGAYASTPARVSTLERLLDRMFALTITQEERVVEPDGRSSTRRRLT